jgi:hypothetical protein
MSDLLPCPFCKSKNLVIHYAAYVVICEDCGAQGPISRVSDERAIDGWNNGWGASSKRFAALEALLDPSRYPTETGWARAAGWAQETIRLHARLEKAEAKLRSIAEDSGTEWRDTHVIAAREYFKEVQR